MLIIFLCAALAVAIRYPETPVGKFFRYWLIEEPASQLARLKLVKIVGLAVFCITVVVIAQAFPPELALLGAVDASAFTELMVAATLLAAHLNARNLIRRLRSASIVAFKSASSRVRAAGRCRRAYGRALARLRATLKAPPADEDGALAGLWAW